MSDTNPLPSAETPAAKGWNGLSGPAKLATVACGLLIGGAVLVVPPFMGGDVAAPADEAKRQPQATVDPFKPPPPSNVSTAGAEPNPFGGNQGRPERRLAPPVPPPVAISIYRAQAKPLASAQAAPAAPAGAGPVLASADGQGPRQQLAGSYGGGGAGGDSSTSLAGQLSGGVQLPQTLVARRMPSPDFLIGAQTHIPCITVEAINSGMGGFVTCRVPEWVRGDNQRRGILPPGTLIKGQIRGGMAQGQRRLGILYTQIVTSGDRFQIPIQGIASGQLGQAGVDARIETFFWEQAGAVALYSLIQGAGGALELGVGSLIGGNNRGTTNLFNFQSQGNSLAQTALQHQLNRTPEATRDQGLPQFVTVGSDLDFTAVCRERNAVNPMACPVM